MLKYKIFSWFLAVVWCLPEARGQGPVQLELTAVFNESPSELSLLKKPESFAISLTGDLYIADTGHNRLVKLNAKGDYVTHVGGFGWKSGQFDMPVDVTCPDALNVYVADRNNQRIQRYDKNLEYISSLGSSRETALSSDQNKKAFDLGYPAGVAVSSQGDLFCTDGERNVIRKINRFGSVESTFGGFSEGRGKLIHPTRVKVTRRFVYVVDESRIVVYDYYGNFISDVGSGILQSAADVAVDDQERLYVADTGRRTIVVFNREGGVIPVVAGYEWIEPRAVEIHRGSLYVLDAGRGTIAVFNLVESAE